MHSCRADGGADKGAGIGADGRSDGRSDSRVAGGADSSADGRIRRFCSGLKTTVLKSSSKLSSCRLVKL